MAQLQKMSSSSNIGHTQYEEFPMQDFCRDTNYSEMSSEQDLDHNLPESQDQSTYLSNGTIESKRIKNPKKLLTIKLSLAILFISIIGGIIISINTVEGITDPKNGDDPNTFDLDAIKIGCYEDLQNIRGYPETIEIVSLTSKKPKGNPLQKPKDKFRITVDILLVSGLISEEWLEYLLNLLSALETLHLNLDGLCEGASVKNRSTLHSIRVYNLKHLKLYQSHICTIITWPLQWSFPNLETIILDQIDFNKKTFTLLCKFLDNHKSRIQRMEVSNCKLCEDCNLSQIPVELYNKNRVTFKDNEHA